MSWYWYVLILILLLLGIMISELKIKILFNKEEKNDYLKVDIWFLYVIHYKKEVPLLEFNNLSEGIKYTANTDINKSDTSNKENRITMEKIKDKYEHFHLILKRIRNLKTSLKNFLKHVHIDNYKWESIIGTGEASNTGILGGLVWSLQSFVIGWLSSNAKLEKIPIIIVKPDYNNKIFHSRFECILRFRVGYFIITGMQLLFKYLIGGRKRWQENTLFKA